MKTYVRTLARSSSLLTYGLSIYRDWQLLSTYRKRREAFWKVALERGIKYEEPLVVQQILNRIKNRGYSPSKRKIGEIHTFACIPQFSWHSQLLPDLRELGPITLFDYIALGFRHDEFAYSGRIGIERRRDMTTRVYESFRAAHAEKPVDWLLCYGGGQDNSASVIRRITDEFGVPTANMTFDDKHGWVGPNVGEHRTGSGDITKEFDLFVTSARVACEWHMLSGGRPIYMPEGVDINHFSPIGLERDIPVSFVGAAYGFRQAVVRFLKKYGIPIRTFGVGWPGEGWVPDSVQIFNRSQINLGMGGIGYSESLTNVKGRDFEIPAVGGGVYLTSFNPDLAQHFVIGDEILCYRNREEMVELIRHYLARPEEAIQIAARGRVRCRREHRWLHRYKKMLTILGVLDEA